MDWPTVALSVGTSLVTGGAAFGVSIITTRGNRKQAQDKNEIEKEMQQAKFDHERHLSTVDSRIAAYKGYFEALLRSHRLIREWANLKIESNEIDASGLVGTSRDQTVYRRLQEFGEHAHLTDLYEKLSELVMHARTPVYEAGSTAFAEIWEVRNYGRYMDTNDKISEHLELLEVAVRSYRTAFRAELGLE